MQEDFKMKEILKVEGMSCKSCVNAIETNVNNLEGVSAVSANLDAGDVAVEFDQTHVTLDQIKEAIEDQGFDVVS